MHFSGKNTLNYSKWSATTLYSLKCSVSPQSRAPASSENMEQPAAPSRRGNLTRPGSPKLSRSQPPSIRFDLTRK